MRCCGRYRCFCSSLAVPQQRAHDVHLRVAGARVGAGAVDLFENHGRFSQAEAAAAVFGGNQRRQPARRRERFDKLFRDRRSLPRFSASICCRTDAHSSRIAWRYSMIVCARGLMSFIGDGKGSGHVGYCVQIADLFDQPVRAVTAPKYGSTRVREISLPARGDAGFSGLPRGSRCLGEDCAIADANFHSHGQRPGYSAVSSGSTSIWMRGSRSAIRTG